MEELNREELKLIAYGLKCYMWELDDNGCVSREQMEEYNKVSALHKKVNDVIEQGA